MSTNSLAVIEAGLAKALKAHNRSIEECGRWLIEAQEKKKEQGRWLEWLDEHFDYSVDTAMRWIAVCRLLERFRKLRNLKMKKNALYYLADHIDEVDESTVTAIEILVASRTKDQWVTHKDVLSIWADEQEARMAKEEAERFGVTVAEIKRKWAKQEQEHQRNLDQRAQRQEQLQEQRIKDEAEVDSMLEGGDEDDSPPLPVEASVGERPSQGRFIQDVFVDAIERLNGIVSKPLQVMADAPVSDEMLGRVSQFLIDIQSERQRR
jgi:hypothetical protein